MKKITAGFFHPKLAATLLAGLVCLMAGCFSASAAPSADPAISGTAATDAAAAEDTLPDFTMADIVAANSRDALLARYDNVYLQMQGEYLSLVDLYVSEDLCFEEFGGSELLVDPTDNWLYTEVNGEHYLVYDWYAMSDEERAAGILTPEAFTEPVCDSEFAVKESIEEITDNGDGTFTLVTRMSAEDACACLETQGIEYPAEYYTSPQRLTYIVDKESLEILAGDQVILAESGEIPFITCTVTHNASQPEIISTMLALIDEFKNGGKENPRTITMIYDYGTDREEDYSITVDRKFKVRTFHRDGYSYVYNDPEKTEVYTGGDGVSDSVMYAFNNDRPV